MTDREQAVIEAARKIVAILDEISGPPMRLAIARDELRAALDRPTGPIPLATCHHCMARLEQPNHYISAFDEGRMVGWFEREHQHCERAALDNAGGES